MSIDRRRLMPLLVAVGAGILLVARTAAPAAAAQGSGLVVAVACEEGAIGTFVITLTHDGSVVGTPRTVQCAPHSAAETTFAGLPAGTYTVTEAAAPGTDAANYRTFGGCNGELRSGVSFNVDVGASGAANCRFLNRLVRSGVLEVFKECRGRSTEGRFRLTLEGTGLSVDLRCGERFLALLPPGAYTVVETAGPGSDPAAYQTVAFCRTGRVGPVSAGAARVSGVVVREDGRTLCTIINIYLRPF